MAMQADAAVPRKYVMGWLKLKPGMRAAFIEEYARGVAATRREPGCIFYDYGISPVDPDAMIIMECFASEAAHAAHLATPHFKAVWRAFERLGVSGTFQDIWSDSFKPSAVRFDAP
jgi:quinol monooxygenase YgiN